MLCKQRKLQHRKENILIRLVGHFEAAKEPKETLVLLLGERTMTGCYSYEGGPNESQKAPEKEE